MSHCHDEHEGHVHDGHTHDHTDDITPAIQFSLYQYIIFDQIQTLNEDAPGSGRAIIKKSWNNRLSTSPILESSADEQLIIEVPFTGQVKLHSIFLRTSSSPSAPRTLKIFLNRDNLDFDDVQDSPGDQVFELSQTNDVQELQVKRTKFSRTKKLTLFFPDNFSDVENVSQVYYMGFKGEWMATGRAPENLVYEAAPNPSDHKLKGAAGDILGQGFGH